MKFGNFHLNIDSEKVCVLRHAILFLLILSTNFRYSCRKKAHFSSSLAQEKHIMRGHTCPGQFLAACQWKGGICSGMGVAGKAIMHCRVCCGTLMVGLTDIPLRDVRCEHYFNYQKKYLRFVWYFPGKS